MLYACKKNVQLDVAKQVDAAGFAILVQACRSNNKPDCHSMSKMKEKNKELKKPEAIIAKTNFVLKHV